MNKNYSEIPLSPSTCLGLDMEEAANRYPLFFTALATKVKDSGGRVVVIAGVAPEKQEAVAERLSKIGLQHDGVFYMPKWDVDYEDIARECPHREELGAYGSWFWLKVHIAEQTGVTHFVDDGAQLWTIFRRFLPNVVVYRPTELSMQISSVSGSGNPYLWRCGDSPPHQARYGSDPSASAPWQPTKAYSISFKGNIEVIYQAVSKWDGVIYTYYACPNEAMLVVPAIVSLSDIYEVLKAGGDGSFIEGWWEEGAHP